MDRPNAFRVIRIVVTGLLLMSCGSFVWAAEKKNATKDAAAVMTQAELQSQVMAYADRYFSIISSAYSAFEAQAPPTENHKKILGICTYSISSAFTIAAESNPVGALLDMVAMVTLGRIIFEENMLPRYGPQLQPLVNGFQEAERDVWQVLSKIATPVQQQDMRDHIVHWRENHPEVMFFPSVRFGDFSAQRVGAGKKEASGLFKSVENATQQVEEARLLAERSMFLATRMPLLTGLFGSVWFSQLVKHPDMEKILNNVSQLTAVSERLTAVVEQLPDRISVERDATIKQAMGSINDLTMTSIDQTAKIITQEREASIDQLMQGLSDERKQIVADFISEEAKLRGLLAELRLTLNASNDVIVSADSLVKGLNLEPSKAKEAAIPGKPFDILEYQATLREASHTIAQVDDVLKTLDKMGLQSMLPEIIAAFESVEEKGQAWVVFAFLLGIVLILVFLVGSVIAMLAYRHFSGRLFGTGSKPVTSG
jgi:hypothetical protein